MDRFNKEKQMKCIEVQEIQQFLSDIQNSSTFCLKPWTHLHVETSGKVMACCQANVVFGDLKKESIQSIWQGEAIRRFRQKQLRHEPDPRCRTCYQQEKAGLESPRRTSLEKFHHYAHNVLATDEFGHCKDAQPVEWDIRFNNCCNFRCRTCWHGASSSWFREAKILGNNRGSKALITSISSFTELKNELEPFVDGLEEIYFAGGEPLITEEHYLVLNWLLDQKLTHVHLRYNTNFSHLQFQKWNVCEHWASFPNVTVQASLDEIGPKAEYIRKGQSWQQIVQNKEYLTKMCPHVHFEINPTVSVFNALNLAMLHRYFIDSGWIEPGSFRLNILERPNYYNIKSLPKCLKYNIVTAYEQHVSWLYSSFSHEQIISVVNQFQNTKTYMLQEDWPKQWHAFQKHSRILDKMRNECFLQLFPEFINFI